MDIINKKFCLLFFLVIYQINYFFSQCSPTAAQSSSVSINDAGAGSIAWANPSNSQISDNTFASAGQLLGVLATMQTNRLKLTSFGFSIPSTATVCGIEVSVRKNAAGLIIGSSITDKDVYIVKSNALTGTNHAAGSWSGTNNWVTYGNSTDTWGTAWTPADINDANFGIILSANLNSGLAGVFLTANIDAINITVYYQDVPLALNLVKFEAYEEQGKVQILLEIEPDKDVNFYDVEKLNSENSWTEIAHINAINNNQLNVYQITDENIGRENYYRLKKTNQAGILDYSSVIYLKVRRTEISLYPVPVIETVSVRSDEKIEFVEIYDELFQLVKKESGEKAIDFGNLKSGIYFVKIKPASSPAVLKKIQKL